MALGNKTWDSNESEISAWCRRGRHLTVASGGCGCSGLLWDGLWLSPAMPSRWPLYTLVKPMAPVKSCQVLSVVCCSSQDFSQPAMLVSSQAESGRNDQWRRVIAGWERRGETRFVMRQQLWSELGSGPRSPCIVVNGKDVMITPRSPREMQEWEIWGIVASDQTSERSVRARSRRQRRIVAGRVRDRNSRSGRMLFR